MIHWFIRFRSLAGDDYVVNIYDDSYTGTPVEIKGASTPLVIEEDNDTSAFVPVRSSSGTLSIVAEQNIDDIYPSGYFDRKVEVLKNGTPEWLGYILPEAYNMPWVAPPFEIDLPIISALEVLKYTEAEGMTYSSTFGSWIKEALGKSGHEFVDFIFPKEWNYIDREDNAALRIACDRVAFFEKIDLSDDEEAEVKTYEGKSYYDILHAIMEIMGWSMTQYKNSIICISWSTPYQFLTIPVDSMDAEEPVVTPHTIDSYDLPPYRGNGHQISLAKPYTAISIVSDVLKPDDIINVGVRDNMATYKDDMNIMMNGVRYFGTGYNIRTGSGLNLYDYDIVPAEDRNILQNAPERPTNIRLGATTPHVAAELVKIRQENEEHKVTFSDAIAIRSWWYNSSGEAMPIDTEEFDYNRPLIRVTAPAVTLNGDAIAIDIATLANGPQMSPGIGYRACLRIGDKYWNGQYMRFQDERSFFFIQGNGANTNYPELEGYIVTGTVTGDFQLDVAFNAIGTSPYDQFITKFEITQHIQSIGLMPLRENARYYKRTGADGEVFSLTPTLMTANGTQLGHNTLSLANLYNMPYLKYKGNKIRIENVLANKMADFYGKARKVVEVEVELIDIPGGSVVYIEDKEWLSLSCKYDYRNNIMNLTLVDFA